MNIYVPWMFKDIAAARHGSHLAVTTVAAAGPLGFCSSTTPVAVTLAFPRSLSRPCRCALILLRLHPSLVIIRTATKEQWAHSAVPRLSLCCGFIGNS